ncbi:olfactory receptor 6C74-like isoform X1 [Hyla sarda]|uniref:olfactory receptor 6C74-like isoform X1 n=1 Tax=Hyla sarda TaxID=327740 RepID=UPI0024C3E70C|nr:olfactory receptor 6C74-like isoform X1 [Hyla sarda]XP_056395782.1 olfactory receptor 6C74-like isoform X1 [Hyla sarda]XP_056395783.1 olfactory receptor 6C74-like isoform X1 [Hyla sarda]XP_056395784.1 olfactory receptor 6C74-like isoform X1 [Hyla sarda]
MSSINQTMIEGFRLKGVSDVPELQVLISLLVLLIYLISLVGNLTILLLVGLDVHLHTPMYFFLSNLSVIDIFSSTTALHRIFVIATTQNHIISTAACKAQLHIFAILTSNELSVLAAMSFDRYVAICRPLHYHTVMSRRLCGLLASVSWGFGFVELVPFVLFISRFTCYISKEIDHYFCDLLPIRDITCSDTTFLDLYILIFGNVHVFILLILTIVPYFYIISCILRISSSAGRRKAFYTCSSHITVVVFFYSSIVLQYIVTISGNNMGSNKIFSLFNTAIVPMMNPLIYSLKNKDVKAALRRQLKLCGIKN